MTTCASPECNNTFQPRRMGQHQKFCSRYCQGREAYLRTKGAKQRPARCALPGCGAPLEFPRPKGSPVHACCRNHREALRNRATGRVRAELPYNPWEFNADDVVTHCQFRKCGKELEQPRPKGQPKWYCNISCRRKERHYHTYVPHGKVGGARPNSGRKRQPKPETDATCCPSPSVAQDGWYSICLNCGQSSGHKEESATPIYKRW